MGPFHTAKRVIQIALIALGLFIVVMFVSGNGAEAGRTLGNLWSAFGSLGDAIATFTEAFGNG